MHDLLERLSLRLRIFLFFAFAGLGVPVLLGGGLWFAAQRIGEGAGPPLVLFGGAAGFAIVGLITWVWLMFDSNIAMPIQSLVRDIQTHVHAEPNREIETEQGRYLGLLAPAANEMAEALAKARSEVDAEVARATQLADEQRARLETVLRDLHEGVLICNLNHQILLYNRHALGLLHVSGEIGLGRSLFSVLNRQPFLHALERLTSRLAEERHADHDDGLTAHVVCATTDGRHVLQGRFSLLVDVDEQTPTGYVVTLEDVTGKLAMLAKRDRLAREAIEGLRRPVANLRAAVEMLTGEPDLDAKDRGAFEGVLTAECEALSQHLSDLGNDYHDIVTGHWPMSDVYSSNLLNCVVRRIRDKGDIDCVMTGVPVWLHCDSYTVVELLEQLIGKIAEHSRARSFDLEASGGDNRVYVDLSWSGAPVRAAVLDSWLDATLVDSLGGLTGREVLEHHQAEVWCETHDHGAASMRLPLPKAIREHGLPAPDIGELPARPEFYDFDLLKRIGTAGHADRALDELTYVVFDTETTGLEPSAGDEIISIAGVRIVNGRILTGESFSQLVNPGRTIPKGSIRFHGIVPEMVKDKPPIGEVLPRFHDYVGDAVLVAHNAAFDMTFLERKQDACGVRFDNPVLDTVLLSAFLHDHTNQHTLDAVADRFGIEIPAEDRHTALGDSIATAAVFLRMIELLRAQNVRTLAEALEASERIVEIRRQQARY
ncbi:MAG: exonuclease domain-containing protein [Methyloligellaceae bacterium]